MCFSGCTDCYHPLPPQETVLECSAFLRCWSGRHQSIRRAKPNSSHAVCCYQYYRISSLFQIITLTDILELSPPSCQLLLSTATGQLSNRSYRSRSILHSLFSRRSTIRSSQSLSALPIHFSVRPAFQPFLRSFPTSFQAF